MQSNLWIGFLLAAAAGLSTTLGSLIGLVVKKPGSGFMSFSLGFSAGIMILVSFVELLQEAIERIGFTWAHFAFFLGIGMFFLIDLVVPHDYVGQEDRVVSGEKPGLSRTGLLVAVGIAIHNFPEGMATLAGSLEDIHLGAAIALAIAIHNVPEGLAVSVPVYAATGSRKKAFWFSFLSGVSEPVGAGLAALVLLPFLNEAVTGWAFAWVGGIMVAISLDEIVPSAKSFGRDHMPVLGILAGMVVMALSLGMLK